MTRSLINQFFVHLLSDLYPSHMITYVLLLLHVGGVVQLTPPQTTVSSGGIYRLIINPEKIVQHQSTVHFLLKFDVNGALRVKLQRPERPKST